MGAGSGLAVTGFVTVEEWRAKVVTPHLPPGKTGHSRPQNGQIRHSFQHAVTLAHLERFVHGTLGVGRVHDELCEVGGWDPNCIRPTR
jgi:hypothetical protein